MGVCVCYTQVCVLLFFNTCMDVCTTRRHWVSMNVWSVSFYYFILYFFASESFHSLLLFIFGRTSVGTSEYILDVVPLSEMLGFHGNLMTALVYVYRFPCCFSSSSSPSPSYLHSEFYHTLLHIKDRDLLFKRCVEEHHGSFNAVKVSPTSHRGAGTHHATGAVGYFSRNSTPGCALFLYFSRVWTEKQAFIICHLSQFKPF